MRGDVVRRESSQIRSQIVPTPSRATPSKKGCYVLYVLLSDGSTRQANFQLK